MENCDLKKIKNKNIYGGFFMKKMAGICQIKNK
jgi:hypothetical protein